MTVVNTSFFLFFFFLAWEQSLLIALVLKIVSKCPHNSMSPVNRFQANANEQMANRWTTSWLLSRELATNTFWLQSYGTIRKSFASRQTSCLRRLSMQGKWQVTTPVRLQRAECWRFAESPSQHMSNHRPCSFRSALANSENSRSASLKVSEKRAPGHAVAENHFLEAGWLCSSSPGSKC